MEILRTLARRQRSLRGVLTQLQGADIGHDRPAVLRAHLRAVLRHRAIAIGDDRVEVAQRRIAQPVRMEVAGRPVASLHDHAGTVAHARVTWRAKHVVLLLPAPQKLSGHRQRHAVAFFAARNPGVEVCILMQLRAGDRIFHLRPHGPAVGVEGGTALRVKLRLVMHVLPAAGEQQHRQHG